MALASRRFYDWKRRYGRVNEHNSSIPRDHWLLAWEKKAIIDFKAKNPLNGARRLAFMMNDAGVVAVGPTTVYRVLKEAGMLDRKDKKSSRKGHGFQQPEAAHQHWHTDISYLNICGTFYYLCSVLDGYSRYIVHWEIREQMKEADVEMIVQRGLDKFPGKKPRIISDNGPQFVARDFKDFVRLCGMDHVRTSPYYPQSNGKIERWHRELKETCIRPQPIEDVDDARRRVDSFVREYNTRRLHSAISYVTPLDKLEGREEQVLKRRDFNLERAREERKLMRRRQLPMKYQLAGGYGSAGGQPERLASHGKQTDLAQHEKADAFCAQSGKPQGAGGTESPKEKST